VRVLQNKRQKKRRPKQPLRQRAGKFKNSLINFMLVIRFFRVGKKNQPSFKIVVNEKRKSAKSGKFIEEVGFYNPLTKEKVLRKERILYWLSVGAKPSAGVANILISEKILEGKKIPKHKKAKEKKEEKPKETKEEKKEETKEEKKEGVDKKV
jgi:small subunit ribosomal protein S16